MTREEFDRLDLYEQVLVLQTDDAFEELNELIENYYSIHDQESFDNYITSEIRETLYYNSWRDIAYCLSHLKDNVGYEDGYVFNGCDEGWDDFEILTERDMRRIMDEFSDTEEYAIAFDVTPEEVTFEGIEELIA